MQTGQLTAPFKPKSLDPADKSWDEIPSRLDLHLNPSAVDAAIEGTRRAETEHFTTKAAFTDEGVVVMWHGDAGYEDGDAARDGARHRLWMVDTGWRYERTPL